MQNHVHNSRESCPVQDAYGTEHRNACTFYAYVTAQSAHTICTKTSPYGSIYTVHANASSHTNLYTIHAYCREYKNAYTFHTYVTTSRMFTPFAHMLARTEAFSNSRKRKFVVKHLHHSNIRYPGQRNSRFEAYCWPTIAT